MKEKLEQLIHLLNPCVAGVVLSAKVILVKRTDNVPDHKEFTV
jgi:hypothetical protein